MNAVKIKSNAKDFLGIVFLASIAFLIGKSSNVSAQSSSSALSGTYVCLSKSNMSGFDSAKMGNTVGINQLYSIFIDPNNPTQATITGLVVNSVVNYGGSNNVTTTTSVTQPNITATITPNTPSQGIYKIVANSGEVTDSYGGVVNGGNTLIFMSTSTGSHGTMNGACQKV